MAEQDPDEVWVVLEANGQALDVGGKGSAEQVCQNRNTAFVGEARSPWDCHVTRYIHADRHAAELAEVRAELATLLARDHELAEVRGELRATQEDLTTTEESVDELTADLTAARQRIQELEARYERCHCGASLQAHGFYYCNDCLPTCDKCQSVGADCGLECRR